jgi:hypothetical protein
MIIFCGLAIFYIASCLYFHYRGFKAGFESGNSVATAPVQTGGNKV